MHISTSISVIIYWNIYLINIHATYLSCFMYDYIYAFFLYLEILVTSTHYMSTHPYNYIVTVSWIIQNTLKYNNYGPATHTHQMSMVLFFFLSLFSLQIEMGMKNHELVPITLVTQIANLRGGGVHRMLRELCKHRLCAYERGKHCKWEIYTGCSCCMWLFSFPSSFFIYFFFSPHIWWQ